MSPRSKPVACLLVLLTWRIGFARAAEGAAAGDRRENHAGAPAAIWRDPGPVASLDLFDGAGGEAHAPDPRGHYTFVKEVRHGFSPKFDVTDEHGVRWRVKLGEEPQAETAATRLLWAAGFFVDEDYYLSSLVVAGLPRLHRGREFVDPDGTVHRARLERRDPEVKEIGDWSWFDNPFVGTREFNGLRIMMAFLDNWDLKPQNNAIHESAGERRYLVSDVGSSLGRTGSEFVRSVGRLEDYAGSEFVHRVTSDSVDFTMHTRPSLPVVVVLPFYLKRVRMERITRRIPRADARWLGERLAPLSDEQIASCFRAAGYSPAEIEGFTKAVRKRIVELTRL